MYTVWHKKYTFLYVNVTLQQELKGWGIFSEVDLEEKVSQK